VGVPKAQIVPACSISSGFDCWCGEPHSQPPPAGGRCRKSSFLSGGFTLLEMMVVLTLVGLVAAATMPRLFLTIEAVRANTEERSLVEMLDGVGLAAFFRQQPRTLQFMEHRIGVKGSETESMEFEYLWFPEQTIVWNGNGFPDQAVVKYQIRDVEKEHRLY